MTTDRPTSATATTTMATPQVRNSRAYDVVCSGGAVKVPGGRGIAGVRGVGGRLVGLAARRPRFAALLAREPGRRVSRHPARRAERHVGYDVVAVRTQHRLVGLDLVVRFVQQREVQAESQQKKCHRGHRQMDGQLQ